MTINDALTAPLYDVDMRRDRERERERDYRIVEVISNQDPRLGRGNICQHN